MRTVEIERVLNTDVDIGTSPMRERYEEEAVKRLSESPNVAAIFSSVLRLHKTGVAVLVYDVITNDPVGSTLEARLAQARANRGRPLFRRYDS